MTVRRSHRFPTRKLLKVCLTALPMLMVAPLTLAQKYPERPIRIINTFPAGGSGDQVIRTVFNRVSQSVGQPYVVDTRAGASGAICTTH
ncbi:MAG: tripartite tricarboxylate transporter substrate binding protein, partial [Betaproteobacteria bacterium]